MSEWKRYSDMLRTVRSFRDGLYAEVLKSLSDQAVGYVLALRDANVIPFRVADDVNFAVRVVQDAMDAIDRDRSIGRPLRTVWAEYDSEMTRSARIPS